MAMCIVLVNSRLIMATIKTTHCSNPISPCTIKQAISDMNKVINVSSINSSKYSADGRSIVLVHIYHDDSNLSSSCFGKVVNTLLLCVHIIKLIIVEVYNIVI